MSVGQLASSQHSAVERTYGVLRALIRLGHGPHQPRDIVEVCGLPRRLVYRRLQQLIEAGLVRRSPGLYGHYELVPLALHIHRGQSLIAPVSGTAEVQSVLESLHTETGEVVMFHAFLSLGATRVCTDLVGESLALRRAVLRDPAGAAALREAPLQSDAPGRVILAHMAGPDADQPEFEMIRQSGVARSAAPLPGWNWVSAAVPPQSGTTPEAVSPIIGAVSLLVPAKSPRNVSYGRLLREAIHSLGPVSPQRHLELVCA
ncbi:helix-turn-helix domain-containing protein [Streptomyces nodosus]|uniref:helix-turn-helix domain-containing protein n=1 Tax=Streptomyces nodosus TaxID=40318 RepID=UPI00345145F7